MPGEFLTDAQEQAYGHFVGPASNQQLSRYFHLDDADRERVNVRRGAHNKLGFALQLTSVRFLGTFLTEPTVVPSNVVAYVAAQLTIRDVACLADYAARPTTARNTLQRFITSMVIATSVIRVRRSAWCAGCISARG